MMGRCDTWRMTRSSMRGMRSCLAFVALACRGLLVACFLFIPVMGHGQVQRKEVPLGDVLRKALEHASLTGGGARPFHVRVVVSEPENAQSPYQGTIEEWWQAAD